MIILLIGLLPFRVNAGEFPLSSSAKISIITCGPGDQLYSTFGHSSFRVKDKNNDLDIIFNFGTFNFNEPNFYLKFARGKLYYFLSTSSFEAFKAEYKAEGRHFIEQVLRLDSLEKAQIFQFLLKNQQTANRFYLYDFFFDNCTTRERDVLKNVLGEQLKFRGNLVPVSKTFRQLIDEYLWSRPWSDFGIDLALGAVIDVKTTAEEQMFLPDYLMHHLTYAKIEGEPLVESTRLIMDGKSAKNASKSWFRPVNLFFALVFIIVGATFWELRKNKRLRYLNFTIFFLYGCLGILLLLLWFATDHDATKQNWNLMWANPLHCVFAIGIFFNRFKKLIIIYWILNGLVLLDLLLNWSILPQNLHLAVIPLIILALIRILFMIWVGLGRPFINKREGNKGKDEEAIIYFTQTQAR